MVKQKNKICNFCNGSAALIIFDFYFFFFEQILRYEHKEKARKLRKEERKEERKAKTKNDLGDQFWDNMVNKDATN